MAKIKLKSGQVREFTRVEFDTNGGTIQGIEDHQVVEEFPAFHVAQIFFDDGKVFIEDEPDDDW